MVKVFVNNQDLTKEQMDILNERFGNWEVISVPRGINQEETKKLIKTTRTAVFFLNTNACLLLATLAYWDGYAYGNSFFGKQSKGAVYFFIEKNKWELRDLTELV
jgi:hypothetical protein